MSIPERVGVGGKQAGFAFKKKRGTLLQGASLPRVSHGEQQRCGPGGDRPFSYPSNPASLLYIPTTPLHLSDQHPLGGAAGVINSPPLRLPRFELLSILKGC